MKNFIKYFALVFGLLFIAAAIVQYNDPDSFKWIAIYGIAALVSLRVFLNNMPPLLLKILAAIYLIWGIISWPEEFVGLTLDSGDIAYVEQGREALGLLVTGIVMAVYAWGAGRLRP